MTENLNLKNRLIEVAGYKHISLRKLEEFFELKRGNISNMSAGGAVGSDKLAKIIDKMPELSIDWLLTGKGKMLRNNQEIVDISNSTIVGANVNGIGISINDFTEMINLQKGYQDLLKKKDEHISKSQEQMDELIKIISKLSGE
jgi:hypothetical protein